MQLSKISAGLITLLLITVYVYFPGLNSRFILDDFYNLQGLGDIQYQGLLYYVFGSGFAGPGGRPLSLLSFALQYQDWPLNPFAFKLFNLILHLLNGVLLFIFSLLLSRQVSMGMRQRYLFAFVVAGLWLLHPVHVNTVLYTVQRMTEIAIFFCLLGLNGYIYGRSLMKTDSNTRGMVWIVLSVGGCTVLSVLGKENGILLPYFVLIIEFTIFAGSYRSPALRTLLWLFLVIPACLLASYLIINHDTIWSSFHIRDFTPGERVLTEFTVIVSYLKDLLLPYPSAFTMFHDGYPVSRGLLSPAFTLVAILIVSGLFATSIILRKRYPIIGLGIFLFLSGHMLEAGPLNLELYFEHRNYLPSIGISILIAWFVIYGSDVKRYKVPVSVFIGIYAGMLVGITVVEASLWSNPVTQVTEWVNTKPNSDRARQELAVIYMNRGNFDKTVNIYNNMMERHDNDIYPDVSLMYIRQCRQHQPYSEKDWQNILLKSEIPLRYNPASIAALDYLVLDVIKNKCPNLEPDLLEKLIITLVNNPDSRMNVAYLYDFLSSLSSYRGNLEKAVEYIRNSLLNTFDADRKLREIAMLDILNRTDERNIAVMEIRNYLQENPRAYFAYHNIIDNLK